MCGIFEFFAVFFGKLEKIQTWSLKIGNFGSNSHYSDGHFFEKIKTSETSHTGISEQINLRNFGTFEIFFEKVEKIRFQVWNLAKFQTWHRKIFNFFKKSLEYSKINEIYLFGNSSEQILSKIRETFVTRFLQGISL